MRIASWIVRLAAGLVLPALVAPPALAEDVEKKFRLGFSVGTYETDDAVESDAANQFLETDASLAPVLLRRDPRNDSGVFGSLTIEPAMRATLSAQYAVTKMFVVEGSVGYQKGDVGDIEIQGQFAGVPIPPEQDFQFAIFRIPAGEMVQIPIQLTAMARFRPRANMNPYVGAGLGYMVIGFDSSRELDNLSDRMDRSTGGLALLQSGLGFATFSPTDSIEIGDLEGAHVDARDTFEWHVVGGAELSFAKKWVAFLDLRYVFASRSMEIGFNGQDSLGVSVPEGIEEQTLAPTGFGAYWIDHGGLIDVGRLAPVPGAPGQTICTQPSQLCEFVFEPDGILEDQAYYYVQGGSIKYGGFSVQLGVRYTF